jgi:hypothetical protein
MRYLNDNCHESLSLEIGATRRLAGLDPASRIRFRTFWIPAFAGMTPEPVWWN